MDIVSPVGIQRTGTTWLYNLINKNFKDVETTVHQLGWKHGKIRNKDGVLKALGRRKKAGKVDEQKYKLLKDKAENREIKAVVIIKNPYTWYESIMDWGRKNGWKERNLKNRVEVLYKNYNKFYSDKLKLIQGEYKDTVVSQALFVKYEDLLRDLEKELKRIGKELDLQIVNKITNVNKVVQSDKFTTGRKNYYLRGVPNVKKEIINKITSTVDWEIIRQFGYKPLD